MVKSGDVFESPRGTRVEIQEMTPELLRFLRRYPSGIETGKADPHQHLDFVQGWEVETGTASIEVEGEPRSLTAGERHEVPKGTKHRDPFNASGEELIVNWRLAPINDFIKAFIDAQVYLLARDELDEQDNLPLLQILVLVHATKGQSFGASPPIPIQKATLPLLALIGRLRGYKASYGGGVSGSTSRPT